MHMIGALFCFNVVGCRLILPISFRTTSPTNWDNHMIAFSATEAVSEWLNLTAFLWYQGPYKPCNDNLYIGIIIFPTNTLLIPWTAITTKPEESKRNKRDSTEYSNIEKQNFEDKSKDKDSIFWYFPPVLSKAYKNTCIERREEVTHWCWPQFVVKHEMCSICCT